uniref:Uncharacterized protein n=1 Tax=viral metagenome TaxID=1070528 RepID=A0A6C0C5Y2_9ZZZZ
MSAIVPCYIDFEQMPVLDCSFGELPFAFGEYGDIEDTTLPEADLIEVPKAPEKQVKSLRFNDEPVFQTFEENRSDKAVPKVPISVGPEDVPLFKCKSGHMYDEIDVKIALLENKIFNEKLGEDFKQPQMNYLVKRLRKENYFLLSDPIGYVTTELLLGSTKSIGEFPVEVVRDCVANIKYILENVEESGSNYVVNYIESFSITNRPGKDQRPAVRKKLAQIEAILDRM